MWKSDHPNIKRRPIRRPISASSRIVLHRYFLAFEPEVSSIEGLVRSVKTHGTGWHEVSTTQESATLERLMLPRKNAAADSPPKKGQVKAFLGSESLEPLFHSGERVAGRPFLVGATNADSYAQFGKDSEGRVIYAAVKMEQLFADLRKVDGPKAISVSMISGVTNFEDAGTMILYSKSVSLADSTVWMALEAGLISFAARYMQLRHSDFPGVIHLDVFGNLAITKKPGSALDPDAAWAVFTLLFKHGLLETCLTSPADRAVEVPRAANVNT